MSKTLKMFGIVAMMGVLMMMGACSSSDDPALLVATSAPVPATVNTNGTVTTPTSTAVVAPPAGTTGYISSVSVAMAPSTVITAKNADGTTKALTAAPTIVFSAPSDATTTKAGVNAIPVASGFSALSSVSGAVEIAIADAASATFVPPITIKMPVPGKAVGSVVKVYTVEGIKYTLLGSYTVTEAGFVSFPVSSLSWKVGDPVFVTSTGGTGTGGSSF